MPCAAGLRQSNAADLSDELGRGDRGASVTNAAQCLSPPRRRFEMRPTAGPHCWSGCESLCDRIVTVTGPRCHGRREFPSKERSGADPRLDTQTSLPRSAKPSFDRAHPSCPRLGAVINPFQNAPRDRFLENLGASQKVSRLRRSASKKSARGWGAQLFHRRSIDKTIPAISRAALIGRGVDMQPVE